VFTSTCTFAHCCTVIVFLETEPLEEYIVMHHQARMIVGPHGAELSNILFATPSAALIELHPKVGNYLDGRVNECHQSTDLIFRSRKQNAGSGVGGIVSL